MEEEKVVRIIFFSLLLFFFLGSRSRHLFRERNQYFSRKILLVSFLSFSLLLLFFFVFFLFCFLDIVLSVPFIKILLFTFWKLARRVVRPVVRAPVERRRAPIWASLWLKNGKNFWIRCLILKTENRCAAVQKMNSKRTCRTQTGNRYTQKRRHWNPKVASHSSPFSFHFCRHQKAKKKLQQLSEEIAK